MADIRILNLHKRYALNKTLITKIVRRILRSTGEKRKIGLEFVFLSDRAITPINKRYKKENVPTDVLSFDLGRTGEIFISLDRALDNCRRFGTRFEDEVVLYVIHGILHLFGYDDATAAGRRRMSGKQEDILRSLWKAGSLSKVLTRR